MVRFSLARRFDMHLLLFNTYGWSRAETGQAFWHSVQVRQRFFSSMVLCSKSASVMIPPSARNVPYFFDISRECLPCHPKPALTAASFKGRIEPSSFEPSQILAWCPSFFKSSAMGSRGFTISLNSVLSIVALR